MEEYIVTVFLGGDVECLFDGKTLTDDNGGYFYK